MTAASTRRRLFSGSIVAGLAAYCVITVAALVTPLIADPGYEFTAAMAIAASLMAGILTILTFRSGDEWDLRQEGKCDAGQPYRIVARLSVEQSALALLPLAIALPVWWFRSGCGPHDALLWYILLVLPSAAISTALAFLALSLARRGWIRIILFILLWSGSMFRGGYEALSGPHIFLYAWPVGFFPGGSWESALPVPDLLLPYRLFTIAVAIALCRLALAIQHARRRDWRPVSIRSPLLTAIGLALCLFIWLDNRNELGLTRTYASLENHLHDTIRLKFGTLHFRRAAVDSLDLFDATRVIDSTITDQCRALGIDPVTFGGADVYLYSSPAEEREMVGVPNLAYTKPWQGAVHMQSSDVPRALSHELAHVVLAPYGLILGLPLSQGMLEGSAVALEGETGWRTRREYVRAAYDAGIAPPGLEIMSLGGFTSIRPQLAYRLAGAFSNWLIRTYGPERFLSVFARGDFQDVYARSEDSLSNLFRMSLEDLPPSDSLERTVAKYLFGGGGFFQQRCLRRIGRLNAEGDRFLDGGEYERAIERYRASLTEGINSGGRGGVLRALWSLGRWPELLDSLEEYTRDSTGLQYLSFQIEWGDALWALGDRTGAQMRYQRIFRLDVARHLTLRAAVRLRFINTDPPLREIMLRYFSRPMSMESRGVVLNTAIQAADSPNERFLLRLMLAALTVRRSPIATVTSLADLSPAEAYPSGIQPEGPLPYLFAIRELARELRSAVAFCREADPTVTPFDPDDLVDRLGCDLLPMPSRNAATWPARSTQRTSTIGTTSRRPSAVSTLR